MGKISKYLGLIFATALLLSSCHHRPLVDPVDTHYIRVYINEEIKNINTGIYDESYYKPSIKMPEVMRLGLYDPSSGVLKKDFLFGNKGSDSKGYYIDGYINCDPGQYQILIYNWDTEITQLSSMNNCYQAKAYTDITSTKAEEEIHSAPDFLFLAKELLTIDSSIKVDTLYSSTGSHFVANSMVENFFIQLPIKGLENVVRISAIASGMSWSKMFISEELSPYPVGLMAAMRLGKKVGDLQYIYTGVNTFGHFPGEKSELKLIFYLTLTDGKTYSLDIDITDIYDNDDAKNHNWIIIENPIDAPIPDLNPTDGFDPGVNEWKVVETEIII